MEEKYIVVNKTKLEERISELTRESYHCLTEENKRSLEGAKSAYQDVINESTSLLPIVSDAYKNGAIDYCKSIDDLSKFIYVDESHKIYSNNLKISI